MGFILVPPAGADATILQGTIVDPGYFATMGLQIVNGRDFTEEDLQPNAPLVVLVNEAFVRECLQDSRRRMAPAGRCAV
jgi:hypothetical protein